MSILTLRVLIVFTFISHFVMSQKNSLHGFITYSEVHNSEIGVINKKYNLIFDSEKSLSTEIKSKLKNPNAIDETHFLNDFVKNIYKQVSFFYYVDNKIYYTKVTSIKQYTIYDTINHDWDILQETKLIGGFTCRKAQMNFRGRQYVAWYTEDIPVPYGPRKYFGLPGLILEVYDVDKKYIAKAISIKLNKQDINLDHELNKLKKSIKNAISFQEFKIKMCEDAKEFEKIVASKLPRGYSNFKVYNVGGGDSSLEIIDYKCDF